MNYEPKQLYQQLGEEQFICYTMAKNFYEFMFIPMLLGIPVFVVQSTFDAYNIVNRLLVFLYSVLMIFLSYYFMVIQLKSIHHYKVYFGLAQLFESSPGEFLMKDMTILQKKNLILASKMNNEFRTKLLLVLLGFFIFCCKSVQVFMVKGEFQSRFVTMGDSFFETQTFLLDSFDYFCTRFAEFLFGEALLKVRQSNFTSFRSQTYFMSKLYIAVVLCCELNAFLQITFFYPFYGFCGKDADN